MTLALVLASSGLLVLVFGHRPIQRLASGVEDPRVVIAAWLMAIVAAGGMLIAGLAVLLLPQHAGVGGLFRSAGGCVIHLANEIEPSQEEVTGLVSLLAMGLVALRILVVAMRLFRDRSRRAEHHRFLLGLVSRPEQWHGNPIYCLSTAAPLAYSIGGRQAAVVVSRGLKLRLAPDAFGAAVEHEQAHLRGHHHRLLAAVDTLAAAIPMVPLLREAPASLRLLVERAADASAASRWGAPAVRAALLAVAGSPVPRESLGMAGAGIADRLARLIEPAPTRSAPRRCARYATLALGIVATPLVLTSTVFLLASCSAT